MLPFYPTYQLYAFLIRQCLGLSEQDLKEREVDHVDIAYNEVPEKHYKVEEVIFHVKT